MNPRALLVGLALLALFPVRMNTYLFPPIRPARIRNDRHGSGTFGAGRGGRKHRGVDLVAAPGALVHAPLAGTVTKHGYPYGNDLRYRYVEITSPNGDRVRVMYVEPYAHQRGAFVQRGQVIGTAQDIASKYPPGLVNHVHVEMRRNGVDVDPAPLLPLVN